jgi:hypothetical protein
MASVVYLLFRSLRQYDVDAEIIRLFAPRRTRGGRQGGDSGVDGASRVRQLAGLMAAAKMRFSRSRDKIACTI